MSHFSQDIAPSGHMVMATVINDDDAAWFNIIDEVAHMALLTVGCRSIQHGVSMASHSKLGVASLDLITLASHA
jgi:hypothetical protein